MTLPLIRAIAVGTAEEAGVIRHAVSGGGLTDFAPVMTTLHAQNIGYIIPNEEIENFQHKNVITRALGMADHTDVDVSTWELEPGDVCLVCCDGLTGMVRDERIAEILAQEPELEKACRRLVDEANENGGTDNITVALVRYG